MKSLRLDGEWTLERLATGETYPAALPGDNFSALLAAGVLDDPYWGANELQAQAWGRQDWAFSRDLVVGPELLRFEALWLYFESVDTVGELFVNETSVATTKTMFVPLRVDIRPRLVLGSNRLRLVLRDAEKEALALRQAYPHPVPHNNAPIQSPARNFLRKVQCHSGWDWGPCLMVSGVYGTMELVPSQTYAVHSTSATAQKLSEAVWCVTVRAELEASRSGSLRFKAELGDLGGADQRVSFPAGASTVCVSFNVENPALWFPRGYGEAVLYWLKIDWGGRRTEFELGFRTLEWDTRDDEWGRSLTCVVNGIPIFAKGANWIPVDALPSRWTKDRVTRLLEDAAAANMNLIRVWGGGRYECAEFYQCCDRLGLLVWQDFMFSCAAYPADPAFLSLVEAEVRYQVRRLQGHACLALFCGNNEDLGALSWFEETKAQPYRSLVDYDRLNEGTIGRVVRELDGPGRWWPSSPSGGVDDFTDGWHVQGRGDMHFWSVWHEGKSFDAYTEVVPRFCSEFGFQSFPWPSDAATYAPPDQYNLTSPLMEHHQKHPRGNSIILETFSRYFRFPQGFANQLYLSQVQQAWAIQTAADYWRSQRPRCMGVVYWQLNDVWPVASWSSITWAGKWKLLHYAARRFFEPVRVVGVRLPGGQIRVSVVNDTANSVAGELSLAWYAPDGKPLSQAVRRVEVAAALAREVQLWDQADLPDPRTAFLEMRYRTADQESRSTLFLTEPKQIELFDPQIQTVLGQDEQGLFVDLSAERPAFWVALDAQDLKGRFDDNGVTLLQGEPRRLRWMGQKLSPQTLKRTLKVFDLFGSAGAK